MGSIEKQDQMLLAGCEFALLGGPKVPFSFKVLQIYNFNEEVGYHSITLKNVVSHSGILINYPI